MQNAKDDHIIYLIKFIRDNKENLYRITYFYLKDENESLNIIKKSLKEACDKLDTLEDVEEIKTWFYRILIQECEAKLKGFKSLCEVNLEDYNITLEELNILKNMELYYAIDELPLKLKTVFVLKFFENFNLDEIAVITKCSIRAVQHRLNKSLKILKKNVGEEFYGCISQLQENIWLY